MTLHQVFASPVRLMTFGWNSRLWLGTLSAVMALLLTPQYAHGQRVPCGDCAGLIAHLEKEWGEDPAVVALDAAGRMVRILANPKTGTWSMLITGPGGPTCLVHHGSVWEQIEPLPESGDPS